MPSWTDKLKSRLRPGSSPSGPAVYRDLRAMALGVDPASVVLPADQSWSGVAMAVMELSVDDATATLVAIADGSTSMYLSTGGGVIGAGEHAAVRDVARRFREVVADSLGFFEPTAEFPVPEPGEVRFHARTVDGAHTAVAPESSLRSGRHPLAAVYAAGQDVITEIRLATPE